MPRRRTEEDSSDEDARSHSSSLDQPLTKRRKRFDPLELCQTLYELIRNYKAADGRLLCEPLIRAPSKRTAPEYYDVVQVPIDLIRIHQKLKNDEYSGLHQFSVDFELLFKNAKEYYPEETAEHQDTLELENVFLKSKERLADGETLMTNNSADHIITPLRARISLRKRAPIPEMIAAEPVDSSVVRERLEDLFGTVALASDNVGRRISEPFHILPIRSQYPIYYNVIKNPIDLKTIACKIRDERYSSVDQMEDEVMLMVKNACTFNEPKSQIYKDAKQLEKIFKRRRKELENPGDPSLTNGVNGSSSNYRVRPSRRSRGILSQIANLSPPKDPVPAVKEEVESENEESDEDNEDDDEEADQEDDEEESEEESDEEGDESGSDEESEEGETSTPQFEVYKAVANTRDSRGNYLGQPFMKLPSKKLYPDYYEIINTPISLQMIRSKIERNKYGNLSELAGDLNVLFENAKTYNRPTSTLHRHAVRLQSRMQKKVRELLGLEEPNSQAAASGRGRGSLSGKRNKFMSLFRAVRDYTDAEGRELSMVFMEKPSKKLYPDYYEVIRDPIDLLMIEGKISSGSYSNFDDILHDFRLLFSNCRQYNEEGSIIYQDADILEKVMGEKVKEMKSAGEIVLGTDISVSGGRHSHGKEKGMDSSPPNLISTSLPKKGKLRENMKLTVEALISAVEEYVNAEGRKLSEVFFRLPSKAEYPDYYEVIRNPMDLERILGKSAKYESLNSCMADITLMLDNACKYNEPESQIFKDAIVLQQVALHKKIDLTKTPAGLPDLGLVMQDQLLQLFNGVYNHCDSDGRCYSDSIVALSDYDSDADGKKSRAPSFDSLKRFLDKGHYRRLDHFQRDLFAVLRRARRLSRTDSPAWEDAVILHRHYIHLRDNLCSKYLLSPAFEFRESELCEEVESQREAKSAVETAQEELDQKELKQEMASAGWLGESCQYNQQTYSIGDYVYVEPRIKGMEPSIVLIEKLYRNDEEDMIFGQWFYRPNETYHLPTRKFLEKEVFPSDNHSSTPLRTILGRCHVMFQRDYFRLKPQGFREEDVYVCEYRYLCRGKNFKKIHIWKEPGSSQRNILISRECPLPPTRAVASIFSSLNEDRVKDELLDLDSSVNPFPEVEWKNVALDPQPQDTDAKEGGERKAFYEQITLSETGLIRMGDFVYVRAENEKRLIAQVERMWMEDGASYFRGPWFVTKEELPPSPTVPLPSFRNSVLLSSIKDTNPLLAILGKCMVYETPDFLTRRPTDIAEEDVYLCSYAYDEVRRVIIPFMEGTRVLPLVTHSDGVLVDEIYLFSKPMTMEQFESTSLAETSPFFREKAERGVSGGAEHAPASPADGPSSETGSSVDFGPPPLIPASGNNELLRTTKGKIVKRTSGYVIYSSENRKDVIDRNPGKPFGEISRMVGEKWRKLPASVRRQFEARARTINHRARLAEDAEPQLEDETSSFGQDESSLSAPPSPATMVGGISNAPGGSSVPIIKDPTLHFDACFDRVIYDCGWSGCDWSFEEKEDLSNHLLADVSGHVWSEKYDDNDGGIKCRWRCCTKTKRMIYFETNLTLMRHIKETHLMHVRPRKSLSSRRASSVAKGCRPIPPSSPMSPMVNGYSEESQYVTSIGSPHSHTPSWSSGNTGNPSPYPYPMPPQPHHSPYPLPSALPHLYPHTPPPDYLKPLPPQPQLEPVFVSPPHPNRLLHSDAYISYIQSLNAKKRTIRDFPRELFATASTIAAPDSARLPSHWLGNGKGSHRDTASALWSLRDHMAMDSLRITRNPT